MKAYNSRKTVNNSALAAMLDGAKAVAEAEGKYEKSEDVSSSERPDQ